MRSWLFLLWLLGIGSAHAEWLVVVGAGSPIESLNERQVTDIFLARTNYLDPVGRITTLELSDEDHHYDFYHRISSKTPAQINSYWTTLIFTGKGKPPREVSNRQQLLHELNSDPGAIAYLNDNLPDKDFKVVATIP